MNHIIIAGSASGIPLFNNYPLLSLFKSMAIISDKGYPDMFLPYTKKNDEGYITSAGLFLELKKEKGKPTMEQIEMIEFLNKQGYTAKIVEGSDNAIEIIKSYLDI